MFEFVCIYSFVVFEIQCLLESTVLERAITCRWLKYGHTYTYMYVYIYIYMCLLLYVYIYIYIV